MKSIGNSSEEARKCQQIAQQMGTKIELSESKDGALTVVIKGPRAKVEETKAKVVRELQTQASRDVEIPKEYHGKLIGKCDSDVQCSMSNREKRNNVTDCFYQKLKNVTRTKND